MVTITAIPKMIARPLVISLFLRCTSSRKLKYLTSFSPYLHFPPGQQPPGQHPPGPQHPKTAFCKSDIKRSLLVIPTIKLLF